MKRRSFLQMTACATLASTFGGVLESQAESSDSSTRMVIGASTGYGMSYLPLTIMEHQQLLTKHAKAFGINASMHFQRYPTPAPMYDDLLSGRLAMACGGITQLLTSWDRTRGSEKVKGVAALNSMPLYLNTSSPHVGTVADFTSKDRIAVVARYTSIEAVILAMSAEQAFGPSGVHRLDPLTVAMSHPEAMKELLSGHGSIDAHLGSAPFIYEELESARIRKVIDSYQILAGPHTHNLVWTTTKAHDSQPKLMHAFQLALQEALDQIKALPAVCAAFYQTTDDVKGQSVAQLEAMIRKPENDWTRTPMKFMAFAEFMRQIGLIKTQPANWKELFFNDAAELPGS